MYSESNSDHEREMRRAAWRRQVRRRRRRAYLTLFGMALIAILLAAALVYGIVRISAASNSSDDSPEVYSGTGLILVDNTDTGNSGSDLDADSDPANEDTDISAFGSSDSSGFSQASGSSGTSGTGSGSNSNLTGGSSSQLNTGLGRLIIIDAGHGGYDGGASSANDLEKDINLAIALKVKAELLNRGYTVYMTRDTDTYVGLNERAKLANAQTDAKALVSIHQNSIEDYPDISGIEAWTYARSGCSELGQALCQALSEATGARNRGVNFRTNLVVTSKTTMPAVIIECGYLSCETDAANLADDSYQSLVATGICNGIDSFMDSYY